MKYIAFIVFATLFFSVNPYKSNSLPDPGTGGPGGTR
jgi:hypothetical protein